jgi:hypothetical protein
MRGLPSEALLLADREWAPPVWPSRNGGEEDAAKPKGNSTNMKENARLKVPATMGAVRLLAPGGPARLVYEQLEIPRPERRAGKPYVDDVAFGDAVCALSGFERNGAASLVTIDLKADGDGTMLTLTHDGLP